MAASLPSTQRACLWTAQEKPLEYSENYPVPQATTAGDVLVRVHTASLNPLDWRMSRTEGGNWFKVPLPSVLGFDLSGEIVAIAPGTETKLRVGDAVFGMPRYDRPGALQEYTLVDANRLAIKPPKLDETLAPCLGIAGLSAYVGLNDVPFDSTSSIYIPGGSGGVGHIAVGVARIKGASRIITSAHKPAAQKWLRETAKVDALLDHRQEKDMTAAVLAANGGKPVDVVFDSTYDLSSYLHGISTLKRGGLFVVLSNFPLDEKVKAAAEEQRVAIKQCDLVPFTTSRPQDAPTVLVPALETMAQWVMDGKLPILVSEVVQLKDVDAALARLKKGDFAGGKIVVKVASA